MSLVTKVELTPEQKETLKQEICENCDNFEREVGLYYIPWPRVAENERTAALCHPCALAVEDLLQKVQKLRRQE